MLKRSVKALSVCVCVPFVLALAGNLALAETPIRIDYGNIEAIEVYRTSDSPPVNGGTVLGGVAGGVIGHQIGSCRGNTAATIAGVIGGAVVGNECGRPCASG